MRAAVIAELEIGDLPASNGTIVANLRRRCGDHELALVVKDQGTTEHKNSREPPKPRKHDITVGGFISVCSVCSVVKKNGIATQAQDHLPNRVCLLHQLVDHLPRYKLVDLDGAPLRSNLGKRVLIDDLPIDRIVHELPSELDPFVDRRGGHPSGFELLVKLFRVLRSNLVDPDSLGL